MNLAHAMEQIADRAKIIPSLNCFAYPTSKITPDAFEMHLPEMIEPTASYRRGLSRLSLVANVYVGQASNRGSVERLSQYVNGTGPRSIVAILESGTYTAFDTIYIPRIDFGVFPIAGTEYLGAQFTIDLTGSGTE